MKQIRKYFTDDMIMSSNGKPDPDKPMSCKCGWNGKHIDLHQRRYISDGQTWETMCGRDGWCYHCPRCQMILDSYCFRVS